jgi:hypothetical protein
MCGPPQLNICCYQPSKKNMVQRSGKGEGRNKIYNMDKGEKKGKHKDMRQFARF